MKRLPLELDRQHDQMHRVGEQPHQRQCNCKHEIQMLYEQREDETEQASRHAPKVRETDQVIEERGAVSKEDVFLIVFNPMWA